MRTAIAFAALGIAIISALGTSWNAFFNPPSSWVRKHVWPLVDLEAKQRELSIDDQTPLEVKVNTLPAKDRYRCRWTVTPTQPGESYLGGISTDNCDPVPLRNFGTAFRAGEQERLIDVRVAVTSPEGKNVGHDEIKIKLLNRARPIIRITPDTVRLNETAQIVAQFGVLGSSVALPYRCAWVIGGQTLATDNCSISHKAAARNDSPAKATVSVRVVIRDSAGNVVGDAERSLSVVWPIGDFYMYAIETTRRMDAPGRGVSLATSVRDLGKQIQAKSFTTASLGIMTFGRADPPDNPTTCGVVDSLYAMQPIDAERVNKALAGIKVDGYRAPLLEAAEQSLNVLTKYAQHNAWLYLVMITGGPDACRTGTEQETLDRIAAAVRSATVKVGSVAVQVLGLTLRLASKADAPLIVERTLNSAAGRMGVPSFQLVVSDESVLHRALEAVAGLSKPDAKERRAACDALTSLLRQQAEIAPRLRERRNVQAEQMEAYCRRARV